MIEMRESVESIVRDVEFQTGPDAADKKKRAAEVKWSLVFCFGVAAVYSGLFLYYHGLRFPMIWDEVRFWRTSLRFSKSLIPSLELLRNYDQLNTPLPFLIFGSLEYFSRDGLFAGRFLNLVLSVIMISLIGIRLGGKAKRGILSAVGLLSFPYYLWLSSHYYTDILAVFFVFAGFWFYLRNQHISSGMSFAMAIACRQFMLAFPLAIVAHEFNSTLVPALKSGSLRQAANRLLQTGIRWIPPSIGALTLLGWFWLFDGAAPRSGMAFVLTPQVQKQTWTLAVDSSLYFLACVGLYFVIPEWILLSRRINLQALFTRKNASIAMVLAALFVAFPPTVTHGLLTKFGDLLPADLLRTTLYCCLALLACVRFSRFNLAFWVVLFGSGLMLKAFPWDKYVLPLLVVFWYLKSIDLLDPAPFVSRVKSDLHRITLAKRPGSRELAQSPG